LALEVVAEDEANVFIETVAVALLEKVDWRDCAADTDAVAEPDAVGVADADKERPTAYT
jgi:hypothetical protein